MKISVVSGGFDPIHSGHISYINAAKKYGDYLIIALNSDEWLRQKKGKEFMPFEERKSILENIKNVDGTKIEIIALDTRFFRSKLNGKKNEYKPNINPQATILGKEQWDWFQSSITNSTSKVIIILSSIQVLATDHPYEKWANFPLERSKLIKILSEVAKNKTVIVVSGDRHRSGIYQNDFFIEITASSLNRPGSKFKESDPLLIGETFPEMNYGILDIQPLQNKITLSLHDKKGEKLNSKIINFFQ